MDLFDFTNRSQSLPSALRGGLVRRALTKDAEDRTENVSKRFTLFFSVFFSRWTFVSSSCFLSLEKTN